jgi:hypothetical protein
VIAEATKQQELDVKATDALSKALFSEESAQRAVGAATRGVTSASQALSAAKKDLAELLAKGAVDHKAVAAAQEAEAQATKDLADAQKAARTATEDLADANRVLNDALRPATVEELTSALDKLTLANLDLGDATDALTTATDDYNKMLAVGVGGSLDPASADELAIAQGDVNDTYTAWQNALHDGTSTLADQARAHKRYTDAIAAQVKLQERGIVTQKMVDDGLEKVTRSTIAVDSATGNANTAQGGYYDTLHKGAENDPAVIAGRVGVATATENVATATQHVADATGNLATQTTALGTALAGDPNFSEDVRAKRQNVADATQHVADAEYSLAQRKHDFIDAQDAKTKALGDGADQAARLLQNLRDLQALNPDLLPLLGPIIGSLATAIQGTVVGWKPLPPGVAGPPTPITVPHGAVGGLIPARVGGSLIVAGEAGQTEALIPLPNGLRAGSDGGGATTNIYLSVSGSVLTPYDLADAVHQALLAKQRRSGSLGFN